MVNSCMWAKRSLVDYYMSKFITNQKKIKRGIKGSLCIMLSKIKPEGQKMEKK